ncbi:hypothetical protein NRH57_002299 [Providencia rettgeri]|nr:hypothetical protein [Providencia rettgeri]
MSESQSVGGIHYDVAMDVKPLLSGEKQVYTSLDRMEGSFNKASKSIESAEKSMFSFSKAAVAVTSALSVGAIVHAVDEWGQMAARIKMALKSAEGDIEKYGAIQERFLEISNRNGKAIETVQSLYAGSASSMKELGYNTEQTVDYIESLSSAFTSNATGAQQTESAMNALNRAMVVGTLRGNDWHSVLNATPSVVGDIAKELSRLRGGVVVTENEVKKMAMETGISMQLFTDAMIHAREENNALADSMDNTVADGFTKLTNSAKAYFGELNQSLGVTRSVSAGFAVLSNNFDSVAVAAMALAAVMTGRLAGAMAVSIQSKLGSVVSARKLVIADAQAAKAEEQLALASLRSSNAAKQRALDEVKLAQMMKASAIGADQVTAAEARLSAARQNASAAVSNYNRALTTHTAAQSASAAAAARASITIGGALRGALGLVGGPVGFAVLAASGLFYFSQKAEEARSNANNLAEGVNNLISKFKDMSRIQVGEEIGKANEAIPELNESVEEARKKYQTLTDAVNRNNASIIKWGKESTRGKEASEALSINLNRQAIAAGELERAEQALSQTKSFVTLATAKLNGEMITGAELLAYEAKSAIPNAANAWKAYGLDIDNATKSKQRFNAESIKLDFGGEQGEALRKRLERELSLSRLQGEAKVRLQVQFAAEDAGTTDPQAVKQMQDLAVAKFNNDEANKENIKQTKVSTKTTDEAGEALKRLQTELTRLNQGYAEGSLELAQYDAAQALGAKASPEQIALAKERAKSIWEVQAATKAATKAEEDRKNSQANFTSLQESVSPVTAIDNQFAKQMEQINQYKQLYPQSIAEAEALRSQIEEQYRQKRMDAQWQELSNASLGYNMLTSAVDSFGGNASNVITGLVTGTMSAADAARSLGNTMLNSVVNSLVQVGVEMLKNFIIGQTMGSAAAAASAGQAALVATAWAPAAALSSLATLGANAVAANTAIAGTVGMAKGLAVAGARYNGGNVKGGSAYEVGEKNLPELMQIGNKLIAIPGNNGRVFSYDDVTGAAVIPKASTGPTPSKAKGNNLVSSGGKDSINNLTVIIENHGSPTTVVDQRMEKGLNEDDVLRIIMRDANEKGPALQSIMANTTATPRL